MRTIKMLRRESVLTSSGTVSLEKDNAYQVEDWMASSLIGRGLAVEVVESLETPSPQADLEEMNIGKLRELGREYNVEGYRKMPRADLVAAIQARRITAQPPRENFEPLDLDGGAKPPVFTQDEK